MDKTKILLLEKMIVRESLRGYFLWSMKLVINYENYLVSRSDLILNLWKLAAEPPINNPTTQLSMTLNNLLSTMKD